LVNKRSGGSKKKYFTFAIYF